MAASVPAMAAVAPPAAQQQQGCCRGMYGARRLCDLSGASPPPGRRRPQYNARGEVQPPDHAFTLGPDWQTGLFACCTRLSGSCSSMWCPQCQLGYQAHRLHKYYPDMDMAVCCGTCCADIFCIGCGTPTMTCMVRGKIAARYKLKESVGCRMAKSCCCTPFAICQQHREMALRGEYCGGICLARDVPLPPAVVPVMATGPDTGGPSTGGPSPSGHCLTMQLPHPGVSVSAMTTASAPSLVPDSTLWSMRGDPLAPRLSSLEASGIGCNHAAAGLPAHLGFVQPQASDMATLSLAASAISRAPQEGPRNAASRSAEGGPFQLSSPKHHPSQLDVLPDDIGTRRETQADVTHLTPRAEKCRPPPLATSAAPPRSPEASAAAAAAAAAAGRDPLPRSGSSRRSSTPTLHRAAVYTDLDAGQSSPSDPPTL